MIVNQLVAIGQLFDKGQYEALVDQNDSMREGYIVGADIDIWKEDSSPVLRTYEYSRDDRYLYALGNLPGNLSQPSPVFGINFDKWKGAQEDSKKADQLKGWRNLGRILVKMRDSQVPIVKKSHDWLESHIDDIYETLSEFLFSDQAQESDAPDWLVFRIKDCPEGDYLWPGEIDAFRELYVSSYLTSVDKEGVCHGCQQTKNLASPFKDASMYTIDQAGFSIGFDSDDSKQFLLCRECLANAVIGLNVLEEELTFRAFRMKQGRNKIPVRFFILPNTQLEDNLADFLDKVTLVTKGDAIKTSWTLERRIEQVERQHDPELPETLTVLPTNLSYQVVFYTIDRTSGMKQIMSFYAFPGHRLSKIQSILNDVCDGIGLGSIAALKTGRLFHVLGPEIFRDFLGALFLDTPVSRKNLLRFGVHYRPNNREDTLRHHFLRGIRARNKDERKSRRFASDRAWMLLTILHVLNNYGLTS